MQKRGNQACYKFIYPVPVLEKVNLGQACQRRFMKLSGCSLSTLARLRLIILSSLFPIFVLFDHLFPPDGFSETEKGKSIMLMTVCLHRTHLFAEGISFRLSPKKSSSFKNFIISWKSHLSLKSWYLSIIIVSLLCTNRSRRAIWIFILLIIG